MGIFVQDIGISLAIALLTIFSLIGFISFHNDAFTSGARLVHKEAVIDRCAHALFIGGEREFNTGAFALNDGIFAYIGSLNDEDVYEDERMALALGREGISYDVMMRIACDGGRTVSGGKGGKNSISKALLADVDGETCKITISVGER